MFIQWLLLQRTTDNDHSSSTSYSYKINYTPKYTVTVTRKEEKWFKICHAGWSKGGGGKRELPMWDLTLISQKRVAINGKLACTWMPLIGKCGWGKQLSNVPPLIITIKVFSLDCNHIHWKSTYYHWTFLRDIWLNICQAYSVLIITIKPSMFL